MKLKMLFISLFLIGFFSDTIFGQDYNETYRPQFHFSPKSGWIGDPDGTIKYDGKYHLFWWGHAISEDLVYWTEYPWPMLGGGSTFDYYSGSVVVDENNTSGFGQEGKSTAVAMYTMHNKTTGIETQGISYSNSTDNKFTAFTYYPGNPVINSSSNDFRDPQVFWDARLNRWAMVITRPGERKIEIYSSSDLKNWNYQSSFEGLGAQKGPWKYPICFSFRWMAIRTIKNGS